MAKERYGYTKEIISEQNGSGNSRETWKVSRLSENQNIQIGPKKRKPKDKQK